MSSSPIKLIVGLGNPGEKYTKTRHNAGFLFLDRLLERFPTSDSWSLVPKLRGRLCSVSTTNSSVKLLEPSTFMNLSGDAVRATMDYFKLAPNELLVVHDELDLPPGVARLKRSGGHGGNNGLRDISAKLGTTEYTRLRIGIGHPGVGRDVASYVLKQPNQHDAKLIEAAIDESLQVLESVLSGEIERAMNDLHTRLAKPVGI